MTGRPKMDKPHPKPAAKPVKAGKARKCCATLHGKDVAHGHDCPNRPENRPKKLPGENKHQRRDREERWPAGTFFECRFDMAADVNTAQVSPLWSLTVQVQGGPKAEYFGNGIRTLLTLAFREWQKGQTVFENSRQLGSADAVLAKTVELCENGAR